MKRDSATSTHTILTPRLFTGITMKREGAEVLACVPDEKAVIPKFPFSVSLILNSATFDLTRLPYLIPELKNHLRYGNPF